MAEDEVTPKEGDKGITLTKEELDSINSDIANATKALVSKDTQEAIAKAKEQGRIEATKETELKKLAEDAARERDELKRKLEDQEKLAAEKLQAMDAKINNLIESKQVIASENPFKKAPALSERIDRMSDEELDKLEEQSGKDFLGEDYGAKL